MVFNIFRIVSILEGCSYLVLLFNMLIIKNIDLSVYKNLLYPIGLAHGLLFVLYIILTIYLKFERNWSYSKFIKIVLASFIPFGTFYADKKWLKKESLAE